MMHSLASRPEAVDELVRMMRILADPTRIRLLGMLQRREMNVTSLCEHLELAQPTVSHHLGLLRSVNLVNNRRQGKQVFYSLNEDTVASNEADTGMSITAGPVRLQFVNGVSDKLLS